MNNIFDAPPPTPLAEMPPELSKALYGTKTAPAVEQSAEVTPPVNPWTNAPGSNGAIDYIDADSEEKSYGAIFSEPDKTFYGDGSCATAPAKASFQFSKRIAEPEPKAEVEPQKRQTTLRYETERSESGLLIRKGFDAAGEMQSYMIVFDETE